MKQDKAEKIIKKAELKAQKAAKQVELAGKKAEIAKQRQAALAQKKAAKVADSATKKAAKKTKRAEQAAKKAQLAAKKAEEKKVKAIAKAADRVAGSPKGTAGAEGEEGAPAAGKKGGKKNKKKLLMIAIPVLAVVIGVGAFFFLRGGKEEEEGPPEPIAAPAEYVLNESHITALPVWGDVLVYQEEVPMAAEPEANPEENSEENPEEGDAASSEEVPTHTVYRYEGLQDSSVLVSAYTTLMTTADAGFSTVDETLLRIDPPEEFGSSGTVQLARNVPKAEDGTGGGVHSLLLSWSGTTCSVTLDTPEGMVRDPKPETPASTSAPRRSLSDIKALHPSKLGFDGESMDNYTLMPQDGSVRIAGEASPTMQINVYDVNGQYVGRVFLSGSGRLYKLDENANAVVELDWE